MYSATYMWAKVLIYLEEQLTEIAVRTWLDDAEVVELKDGKLIVYSPSDFRQENIRTRCAPYIEEGFRKLFNTEVKLEVWGDSESGPSGNSGGPGIPSGSIPSFPSKAM